jgi:hypothetical protein
MRTHLLPAVALLALVAAATSAGAVDPPVTIELSPTLPSSLDPIRLRLAGAAACAFTLSLNEPVIAGDTITVTGSLAGFDPCPPPAPWSRRVDLGRLSAGNYRLHVDVPQSAVTELWFTVRPPATTLPLFGGRFTATLRWTDPRDDSQHVAQAVRLADASGYFWFFDSGNVELTVKMLDARPLNGRFWVFVASMTTVPYTLTLEDRESPCAGPLCSLRFYSSAGGNENAIDLDAFR